MYDSTLILSPQGTILSMDIDANDKLFEPGADYVGSNINSLFDNAQPELIGKFLEQVFSTGKLQTTSFYFRKSFYQVKGIVGIPQQAICIVTNDTRHRNVLLELEEHNLNVIVDAHVDWVWSFDTNYTLVTANKAFLEGRRKANKTKLKIGESIFKYVTEASYKKWLPIYERALKGEIISFEERRSLEGIEYDADIYLTPVYNSTNEIIGCLGVTRDITERKKAELAIKGYTRKLEEFAFRTSHDLRRPIANIMGMANLINDVSLSEEEHAKAIQYISESVNELDDIVLSMTKLIQQYQY